jgi:hypothetical protein
MKIRAITGLDGCAAASHEFNLAREDNSGAGPHAARDYSREKAPGSANDVTRLKLVLEKGGDRQMILRVDRAKGEDLNQIVICGGTPTGTNVGTVLRADRIEILVWALS